MSAAEHEAAIGRLLAELGDTADKVADTLRAKGIKGVRESYEHCPIAKLLQAEDREHVVVLGDSWEALVDDCWLDGDLPQSVRGFVERFDAGVYLDLVEVP